MTYQILYLDDKFQKHLAFVPKESLFFYQNRFDVLETKLIN